MADHGLPAFRHKLYSTRPSSLEQSACAIIPCIPTNVRASLASRSGRSVASGLELPLMCAIAPKRAWPIFPSEIRSRVSRGYLPRKTGDHRTRRTQKLRAVQCSASPAKNRRKGPRSTVILPPYLSTQQELSRRSRPRAGHFAQR